MIAINTKRGYTATETVTTHELQEGDLITCHGGIFELGQRNVSQAHEARELPAGDTVWFSSTYIGRAHSDTSCGIPTHWRSDESPWQVQGNGLARWARITDATPQFYHGQELSDDGTIIGGNWQDQPFDEGELLALQRQLQS